MLRIDRAEPVAFASDVHLSEAEPDTARRFLEALDAHGASSAHLFLLGDLFEMWVGDDCVDPLADALGERISRLARAGVQVWAMRGNRDFLLDVPVPRRAAAGWAAAHGATMLPDPCPITLHGEAALLSHGDALCTDDLPYQAWRRTCRDPAWQQGFLARPLAQRLAMGRALREDSDAGKRQKPESITDVNAAEVERAMLAAGATLLVHGHTHRPADHRWTAGDTPLRRVVLTDWDAAADRGSLLLWVDGRARPAG